MKKLAVLLLTLALAVCCFAACSKEPAETNPTTTAPSTVPTTTAPEYDVISIAEALELCGEEGNITTEKYYIRGTVDSITNPAYGAMIVSDETGTISVYNTAGYADMDDKPYAGDEVLLYCVLQNYNGTKEVKAAELIEFKHAEIDVDESQYTEMSIADARNAETGTLVKVDGVVAKITYANGQIPAGLILVDETSSIYVYDSNLAGRVKEGNQITILASKTYWILGDETENAAKFGYKGCNQLESATLLETTADSAEFDKSWIQEATVKQILDTPVTEDITTIVYKVNALVSKVPGNGFTNYYFNDLDGTTGSYTYTQCNGADFAWLDEFDGKICTVYLTVLNAKSTDSGCVYRFLPVAVSYDGYVFDANDAAEYAVKYVGVGQFQTSYTGNPALELATSVSSDMLGFQDARLSYSSSDSSVISIDTASGKPVMNCNKTGTATITIKASYNGAEYSETVTISVTVTQQVQTYPTVSDAIAASVGETVTVKGIVGPSLVNKTGFYLIDDSGVIAVLTDTDTLSTLKIGHEVVLQATRHNNTKGGTNYYGQTCLIDATVVTNNYGSHEYSTSTFVTGKTLSDFYNLDVMTDYSTTVFVLNATVEVEESKYYTKLVLTNNGTTVELYCSDAKQYNWLKQYAGQEVTLEMAACNWNDKNFYKGCVLAVRLADGSKVVNELNFQN